MCRFRFGVVFEGRIKSLRSLFIFTFSLFVTVFNSIIFIHLRVGRILGELFACEGIERQAAEVVYRKLECLRGGALAEQGRDGGGLTVLPEVAERVQPPHDPAAVLVVGKERSEGRHSEPYSTLPTPPKKL